MKIRKLGGKLLWLILPLCLLLSLGWAFAAEQTGSISLTLTDDADLPVSSITVSLFHVSDPGGTLTPAFAASGISAETLLDSRNNAQLSARFVQYIKARGLTGDERVTDPNGYAAYNDLDQGIYLVMCKDGQELTFTPFLAYIPTVVGPFTLFDIESTPKAEETDRPDVRRYRVSYRYSGDVPAGAPPCPDDAWYTAGSTVFVAREPQIAGYHFVWTYDPAELPAASFSKLSAQGAGGLGVARLGAVRLASGTRTELSSDSFTMPANDVHIIGVWTSDQPQPSPSPEPSDTPEPSASPEPSGTPEPSASPEPSAKPDDPKLPQTGVNKLSAYLLLGAGGVFLLAGVADLCRNRRRSDE